MGLTVIRSVKLFDGGKVWQNAAVSFDSSTGKILSVISDEDASVPAEAIVVDGKGYTLIPGLIEGHVHAHVPQVPKGLDPQQILTVPLRCGITTLCDMHSDPEVINEYRRYIKEEVDLARGSDGFVTWADLKSALFAATIDGGWPKAIVLHGTNNPKVHAKVARWPSLTIENAAEFVQSNKKLGADYIKLMQESCSATTFPAELVKVATKELQKVIIDAAHSEGLITVGHAFGLEDTKVLLDAGVDGLAHTFMDQAPTEDLICLYKKTNAFVVPTLTILASMDGGEQALRDKFAMIGSDKDLLNPISKKFKSKCLAVRAPHSRLEYAFETIRRLHREGIDVVAGTDSMVATLGTALGPSLWMELEMLVTRCGFSVSEALAAATSVAARRLGFEDRGIIAVGKRADLVLVKGDATNDLEALWKADGIVQVWKEGLKAGLPFNGQASGLKSSL